MNQVVAAYPGTGSEAIQYPACGGQSNCGGVPYEQSAQQGTAAVVKAVTDYNKKCPSTQIVLIGYSQVWHNVTVTNYRLMCSRVVKSWTMRSAAVQAQLSLVPPSMPSRLPSSWVTHTTALVCRTTLALALPKA